MAAKIYTGTGPSLSTESEFSVGNISKMLGDLAASKRADAQLLMQQAQHDWQVKTLKKTENTTNAISEWSGKDLPWDSLTSNPQEAFGKPLPEAGPNWKGYRDALTGLDITADPVTFMEATMKANQGYMNVVSGQFNAIRSRLQAENPLASPENINRVMQADYNADMVYGNMIRSGLDPSRLDYDPTIGREVGWGEWAKSKIFEPEIEGQGGQFKPTAPAVGVGIIGGSVAGFQYKGSRADYLAQAEKDWGKMKADKFKTKYGMTKTQAGGSPGKSKTFIKSKDISKLARKEGYGATWPTKAGKSGFIKGATTFGKGALPYAAGGWAGAEAGTALTEALGGSELAQAMGGVVGGISGAAGTKLTMTKVAKKLTDPKVIKRITPILKKIAPKLAAKLGLSMAGIVIPEGFSSALGAAGLAWSAYDLVQLANKAPEIYAALAGD